MNQAWNLLTEDITNCRMCPRLVKYREEVARTKVRRFMDHDYWGRPVPAFGDPNAWLFIVGLAPAAHGANRTGRMFTGDRSGDFLYAALHRAGLANQSESIDMNDGLELDGVLISASARCAPPKNRPTAEELRQCSTYIDRERSLLPDLQVVLVLGQIAFDTWVAHLRRHQIDLERKPRFSHGSVYHFSPNELPVVASYHVSQQNTQTGRLTPEMFDEVLATCQALRSKDRK